MSQSRYTFALLGGLLAASACATPPDEVREPGGKADAARVRAELDELVADGVLDAADVDALFTAARDNVSLEEMLVIREAVTTDRWKVEPEALVRALERARLSGLLDSEIALRADARAPSYAGTDIPEAVQELIARARLNGAVAYDVREVDDDDGELEWTPYPSTTPATANMTFEYTELTPQALADDLADADVEYNVIVGSETAQECNASGCFDYQRARYEVRTGGTGNVAAHYDEVFHPDIYARGRQGQKWASNCAILSDGSIHCLPASRRSELGDLILTNPHLSRCHDRPAFEDSCRTLLYNGHITVSAGVVTSVEVSGRISKKVARGRAHLIDPIAVLQAWGFELAPNLDIHYGNTEDGVPERDLEGGVLVPPRFTP